MRGDGAMELAELPLLNGADDEGEEEHAHPSRDRILPAHGLPRTV